MLGDTWHIRYIGLSRCLTQHSVQVHNTWESCSYTKQAFHQQMQTEHTTLQNFTKAYSSSITLLHYDIYILSMLLVVLASRRSALRRLLLWRRGCLSVTLMYCAQTIGLDVKNVQIKIKKTLKNVKKRDKNKKNVCKRNKKSYLFLV